MKRILAILAASICLCSCDKETTQKHEWLSRTWVGEYETKVQSNDTGEYTTITAGITLEFSDDKSVCSVKTSYSGLLSMNSQTYYTSVHDDTKEFSLRKYQGDVEIEYFSEIVSDKRILKWRKGEEEMAITIEAIKVE